MVQNRTFYNNFTFRVEQQQSDTVLYGFLPAPALLANDLNDSAVCWKIFKESVCTSVPDRKLKHSRNMIWSTEAGPSQSSSNGIRRRLQRFCQSPDLGSLCFSALRRSLIKTVLEKKKKIPSPPQCVTDLLPVFSLNSWHSSFSSEEIATHLEWNISLSFNRNVDQTGFFKSTWSQWEIAVETSTEDWLDSISPSQTTVQGKPK